MRTQNICVFRCFLILVKFSSIISLNVLILHFYAFKKQPLISTWYISNICLWYTCLPNQYIFLAPFLCVFCNFHQPNLCDTNWDFCHLNSLPQSSKGSSKFCNGFLCFDFYCRQLTFLPIALLCCLSVFLLWVLLS